MTTSPGPSDPRTHEIGKRSYVVAEVDPLDVDGVRTVAVGTAVWLVAFLALLPFVPRLREDGHLWWLWTCLAGFGLGMGGWDYCRRRRRARLAALEAGHPEVAQDIAEHPVPSYVGRRRAAPPATEPVAPPAPVAEPAAQPVAAEPTGPVARPPGPGSRPPFRAGPKKS